MLVRAMALAAISSALLLGADADSSNILTPRMFSARKMTVPGRKALENQLWESLLAQPPSGLPNLSPKVLPQALAAAQLRKDRKCAIPLKELHVQEPEKIDKMGVPVPLGSFDSIGQAPPVPACRNW